MTPQIVLVTGASSGIGKAIATYLAARGFYVFAAARRMDYLESMRSSTLEPLYIDVTDAESIDKGLQHIATTKGRLDVLVNNAGCGVYGTLEGVDPATARYQFDVNVFGLAQITQKALPIMRTQRCGRIINISSVAGKVSVPMAGWYSASKHAVEALSDALRGEVAPFGIKVIVIEAGAIKTNFDASALRTLAIAEHAAYHKMAHTFSAFVRKTFEHAPGPEVIAVAVYQAIQSPNPRIRHVLPNDARMFIFIHTILGDRILDWIMSRQLRG